ncbi:Hypothetical_protein [Hexamita inflata]|uniref:Hypothetical_protein n=1 Tax=Hexamita inflata TaxID=28002 RepID=A0AA86Q2Q1_9EUKA|nr:Hypothetical protein HINF_LOCUS36222 [Hexamita inflata]
MQSKLINIPLGRSKSLKLILIDICQIQMLIILLFVVINSFNILMTQNKMLNNYFAFYKLYPTHFVYTGSVSCSKPLMASKVCSFIQKKRLQKNESMLDSLVFLLGFALQLLGLFLLGRQVLFSLFQNIFNVLNFVQIIGLFLVRIQDKRERLLILGRGLDQTCILYQLCTILKSKYNSAIFQYNYRHLYYFRQYSSTEDVYRSEKIIQL